MLTVYLACASLSRACVTNRVPVSSSMVKSFTGGSLAPGPVMLYWIFFSLSVLERICTKHSRPELHHHHWPQHVLVNYFSFSMEADSESTMQRVIAVPLRFKPSWKTAVERSVQHETVNAKLYFLLPGIFSGGRVLCCSLERWCQEWPSLSSFSSAHHQT